MNCMNNSIYSSLSKCNNVCEYVYNHHNVYRIPIKPRINQTIPGNPQTDHPAYHNRHQNFRQIRCLKQPPKSKTLLPIFAG